MAILTGSAARVHRLAVTSRIVSAGFEILAERTEQWHTPQDDDFLDEFLRCEPNPAQWMSRLTGGPIVTYVLERRRAAHIWSALLGPEDPTQDVDLDASPNAKKDWLRAIYGNNFYGSPVQAAERQIGMCFPELAREPNYITTPAGPSPVAASLQTRGDADVDKTVLVDPDEVLYDEQGLAYDANNGEQLELHEEISVGSEEAIMFPGGTPHTSTAKVFRARPIPATHRRASIQPRMSRAAALRLGIELPPVPTRQERRSASDASSTSASEMGISGLPKAPVAMPRSLSKPTIAPRMNKVAAARTGSMDSPATKNGGLEAARERKAVDFSNTPGHKRMSMSGIHLASLAPPTVAPRANRTSAARTSISGMGAFQPPRPTSAMRRNDSTASLDSSGAPARERKPVDFSNTPGHKRASLLIATSSKSSPAVEPRLTRAVQLRSAAAAPNASPPGPGGSRARVLSAPTSDKGSVSSQGRDKENTPRERERKEVDYSNTPGHKRASLGPAALASLAPPSIAPRSNRASEARLAERPSTSSGTGSGSGIGFANVSRPSSTLGHVRISSRASNYASDAHQDGAETPNAHAHIYAKQRSVAPSAPSAYRYPGQSQLPTIARPPSRSRDSRPSSRAGAGAGAYGAAQALKGTKLAL